MKWVFIIIDKYRCIRYGKEAFNEDSNYCERKGTWF